MYYSSVPLAVRAAVMLRNGGRCEDCQQELPLTLHHLHYRTVGRESPDDLAALCWECHQQKHRLPNGDYCRDPEEAFWENDRFNYEMSKDD